MSSGNREAPHNRGFKYIELEGAIVRLRPTRVQDAPAAFPLIYRREPILRWLCWDGPANPQELAYTYGYRWPADMRSGCNYHFAIEETLKPGIVGCIGARIKLHPGQFDIGYWLGEKYWGKGYVTEALGLLCHFCFTHLNADVIHVSAFCGNAGSLRVQQKNGFVLDGTIRHDVNKNGQWLDMWHSSLLKTEWQEYAVAPLSEKLVPASVTGNFWQRLFGRLNGRE